ncbi:MAG: glycosyltransferase family 4 protein [Epsilonproteobacteria bacterium]|nr:glycosyltransferase family 4 protein [Campylobacterota bacterium]
MKVLVISHTYIASVNREKWLTLARLYCDVFITVIYPKKWLGTLRSYDVETESFYGLKNCRFVALDVYYAGNESRYFYKPISFFTLLKEIAPDVAHVEQGDCSLAYLQTIFFLKILSIQSSCVFFTWINWKPKVNLGYRIFWQYVQKINRFFSEGAITGNCSAQKLLREQGFKQPVKTLPQLGVDCALFKPAQKIDTRIKKIIFVGRFIREKGIFLLAHVFGKLIQDNRDWRLVFVGTGADKCDLVSALQEWGISEYVQLEKPMSHELVAPLIAQAEILVLPSYDTPEWKEQFGHVLIEAMACRVAVLASDAGDIPAVVGDAGLIFQQKNEQSLLAQLKTLMQDEALRESLKQRGYQRVIQHYSHEKIARSTYAFWQLLLEKRLERKS